MTGLTLGKYAPFHKGHQYLIEKALAEVDKLFVLIYDAESTTAVPLSVRARWIRTLYPQVYVIECWAAPEGYSNERAFEIQQEEYILKMLNGQKIDKFYSSEFYGAHVSLALGAEDCRVDEARQAVPISATMIREDPYKYRGYISDIVYADLITKVVLLGAPSTGKSTLAEALAAHYDTVWNPEYGREYWTTHQVNRLISFEGFDIIAQEHIRCEDEAVQRANRYLFVDTNAITTYMFSMDGYGKTSKLLTELAYENSRRYDLVFVCEDDIPYDDTWDRSGDQKRHIFHRQIKADLAEHRIPYISLYGSIEERIREVDSVLKHFVKYKNFFDL
ncbi:MAG: AAA family ATPase [Deferribacteraceae bacterium]|jgi:NadR type nicotinamide-nucleotide adenylyltransferase|nr:AAA family ATPase [Deferribacteraceae bacterium]